MKLDNLLIQYSVEKSYFIELFNISQRTYDRWNKDIPAHVKRLFIMLMDKPRERPDCWKGWWFDREFIIDPDGNDYQINEIRAIFFNRQLIETLTGSPSQVRSLKTHLEGQLKAQKASVNIQIMHKEEVLKEYKVQL